MKRFLAILLTLLACLAAYRLWQYYERWERERESGQGASTAEPAVAPTFPPLPPKAEQELAEAKAKGAAALKAWLAKYRRSPLLTDPRLAWIELDYVVLLSRSDPLQAKALFSEVRRRVPTDSPVYPRIQQLEKAFE